MNNVFPTHLPNAPLKKFNVFILILNYQSYEDTIVYVKNLLHQKKINLKILIVDNFSPNGSFEQLQNRFSEEEKIETIKSLKNGGYAYGNNFGLRYIEDKVFDYLLISNNDIKITDDELIYKLIIEYNKLKNVAFVAPMMKINNTISEYSAWRISTFWDDLRGSSKLLSLIFKDNSKYQYFSEGAMEVDCLPGSFFLCRKDIIYQIGLFDENTFLYMEETILAYKIKNENLKNFLINGLSYEHLLSKTISSQISLYKMGEYLLQSRLYFHDKYLNTNRLGMILLKLLFKIWKIETFIFTKMSTFLGKDSE